MLFGLYLILVDKPRIDDSNLVRPNLTQEVCQKMSVESNSIHQSLDQDAVSRYIWTCSPMSPEVDNHKDMFRSL
jgi:hypothetical protein